MGCCPFFCLDAEVEKEPLKNEEAKAYAYMPVEVDNPDKKEPGKIELKKKEPVIRANHQLTDLCRSQQINARGLAAGFERDYATHHSVRVVRTQNCYRCSNAFESMQLACGHKLCKRCTRELCLDRGAFKPLPSIKCPQCKARIIESDIAKVYDIELLVALQNDEGARRANFTCDICYDLYHVDEAITLDCDHRFCKNCIGEYLKEKITSAEVSSDKLVCPSCASPISIHTIQYCVDEVTFSKYNDFAIRQINFAETQEVLK
jgi:hypothetical protein